MTAQELTTDVELATNRDKVNVIFKMFDKDKNGKITKAELAEVLQFLDSTTWNGKAVETLLQGSDKNGDGELQFTEFWSWVCGHGGASEPALQEALLDKAVEKEKAYRISMAEKRERWEANKAERERLEAEKKRKEAERSMGSRLSREEFVQQHLKVGLNKKVANGLFAAGDEDNDGEIDLEELSWLAAGQAGSVVQIKGLFQQACREDSDSEDPCMMQVIEIFTSWDTDGSGTISAEELGSVIRTLNPDMGEKTVEMIMREADVTKDGSVDIFEFVGWLSGSNPKKKKAKEEREAKIALALARKRSEEAHSLGLQLQFEQALHKMVLKCAKNAKIKVICGTQNPGSSSKCEECKSRHAWVCHGCGFASFYNECIHGCSGGAFGWSCLAGKCVKKCGCKRKPEFWQRRGFALDLAQVCLSVEKMLEAASAEEPWEREVFDKVRSCLSPARCGLPIEEVFRRLDRLQAEDGALSRVEFDRLILTYRSELSPPQLHRLFSRVNKSGSGEISFTEFKTRFGTSPKADSMGARPAELRMPRVLGGARNCLSAAGSGPTAEEVFRRLDRLDVADGTLSHDEFDKMIQTYKPELTSQQLEQLFLRVNTSGSGSISLQEFKDFLGTTSEATDEVGSGGLSSPAQAEESWARGIFDTVRSCLSSARSGLPLAEVFQRLDKLQKADGGLSPTEFEKLLLTYRPELSTQQLKKLFGLVNTSGSGKISFNEFQSCFGTAVSQPDAGGKPLGGSASPQPLVKAGAAKDAEREKVQQQPAEAWVANILKKVSSCLSPERSGFSIEEVFRRLDRLDTADNTLSPTEFFTMIQMYEQGLSQRQLQQLFSLVNSSGSGRITLPEFKKRFGASA